MLLVPSTEIIMRLIGNQKFCGESSHRREDLFLRKKYLLTKFLQ